MTVEFCDIPLITFDVSVCLAFSSFICSCWTDWASETLCKYFFASFSCASGFFVFSMSFTCSSVISVRSISFLILLWVSRVFFSLSSIFSWNSTFLTVSTCIGKFSCYIPILISGSFCFGVSSLSSSLSESNSDSPS